VGGRSPATSLLPGSYFEGVDADERQAEVSEPLEQTVKRRLVRNEAYQYGVSMSAREPHSFECRAELIAQLARDL